MNTSIQSSEFSHFMRKLQARAAALRTEIRETLLRADNEQYVQLAGQVHDADQHLGPLVAQALGEPGNAAVPGEEVKGLRIRVEKAAGEKCERCWNYATTIGESDAHPTVCHRCREALI